MRKVVITGIGVVTPLGNNIKTTWDNLTRGLSGIGYITKFDAETSKLPVRIAGELKNFSTEDYISKKDILRLDPFIHYATAASLMAAEDAGLIKGQIEAEKIRSCEDEKKTENRKFLTSQPLNLLTSEEKTGVIVGSSRGGIMSIENALEKHLLNGSPFSAYLMSSSTINMASSYIAMKFGIRGPAIGMSTACASGTNAIGEAMRLIRSGDIDMAIAGGAEAPVCKLAVGGYGAAGALSKRNDEPEKASRPFDRDRDGFVIAEGAGIVVLEEFEHALKRNARIYAELAGYGTSSDAFHQTKPDSNGEALAIKKALDDAKITTDDVDLINAHATSTVLGDLAETQAIIKAFGDRAHDIPVNSYKSMLGHILGGAGAVEAALTALSINKGVIIPTTNLENPDPGCNLKHTTSITDKEINIALSNSFGFGGVNAVLVLKKFN